MKLLNFAIGTLALSVTAIASPLPSDCIPVGGSQDVGFDRPPIDGPGMPAGASWTGGGSGNPQTLDADFWSAPDDIGAPTPSSDGNSANIEITNSGGELFGPDGEQIDSGLEGDCAELYTCWSFRYTATVERCIRGGVSVGGRMLGGEVGGATCISIEMVFEGFVCDGPKEVCPC
jgi:hypothetical protein